MHFTYITILHINWVSSPEGMKVGEFIFSNEIFKLCDSSAGLRVFKGSQNKEVGGDDDRYMLYLVK